MANLWSPTVMRGRARAQVPREPAPFAKVTLGMGPHQQRVHENRSWSLPQSFQHRSYGKGQGSAFLTKCGYVMLLAQGPHGNL